MLHNISQPMYEEFVLEKIKKDSLVEVRKNHSFVSLTDVCNIPSIVRQLIMLMLAVWWLCHRDSGGPQRKPKVYG